MSSTVAVKKKKRVFRMDVRALGVSPPNGSGGGGRERGASEKGCAAGADGRARETE